MKKKINSLMIITTAVCLFPVILSVALYSQLPNEIPIHFNYAGKADNYLPKAVVCFGLPLIFSLLNILVHFLIDTDPKKVNISKTIKIIVKWTIPLISVVFIPISLFISLEKAIPIHIIVPALVGVLIMIYGNYMPKSRQNYTTGIRLPWTLNNENNWNKTHRLTGVIWVLGGFVILITSLIQFFSLVTALMVIAFMIAVPFVYSFILYKKEI